MKTEVHVTIRYDDKGSFSIRVGKLTIVRTPDAAQLLPSLLQLGVKAEDAADILTEALQIVPDLLRKRSKPEDGNGDTHEAKNN
jgi:hypothetical protein